MTVRDRWSRHRWATAVPLVTVLAGVLFATSSDLAGGTDLRVGQRTQITDLIAAQERDGSRYRQRIEELSAEIESMSARAARHDSKLSLARDRAEQASGRAGFQPVEGPGLRVTLDDAAEQQGDPQGVREPTANDLVVHQQDVQAVVNALWAGGARAMEIMDQRAIATNAVRCVGNTLIFQGVVYSPPYTITAVGDPERLAEALRDAPQVQVYLEYVAAYGLGYQVEELDSVTLSGHEGVPELAHARVPQS